MEASQVAGLLVLLGVVGVLAAIIGSGLEAGPVKFPSIPGSRQKPLAVASVVVVAGGIAWWAVQQRSTSNEPRTAGQTPAAGKLRVLLIPAQGNIRAGDPLVVRSEVSGPDSGLGTGQCVMTWREEVAGVIVRRDTTDCDATYSNPAATRTGVHHVNVSVEGTAGATGTGSRSVDVTVG